MIGTSKEMLMNHCPKNRTRMLATACSLALGLGGACVAQAAGNTTATPSDRTTAPSAAYAAPGTYRASGSRDAAHDAMEHVDKAVAVVHRMESEPHVKQLLDQAKGVFIIPRYGRAALGIGGRGGAGVLMVKRSGTWGNPAFYNYGGISAGVQAGVEGGAVAFVLNDDKAVRSFTRQDNNWSLNAEAGLTIVAWSDKGQGSAGKGDVTVWSDTKGLFGDLAIRRSPMRATS
jgi:lipid-binding SYLF domain-containing protein